MEENAKKFWNDDIPIDIIPDRPRKMVESLVSTIDQYGGREPYQPFAPGTPTRAARSDAEAKRQYDQDFAESKRRWDIDTATGGSRSGIAGTVGERENQATSEFYGMMDAIYNRNREYQKFGAKPGETHYNAGKYPLYYALNDILRNPKTIEVAMAAGVDVKSVIDSLIRSKTGTSPDKYFSAGKGKEHADRYYSMFPQKSGATGTDGETFLIGDKKYKYVNGVPVEVN